MSHEGILITIDDRPAVQFVRRYARPIERVWRAVSDTEEMARWFPAKVIGDREVGASLTFDDSVHRSEAIEAGEATRADGPLFTGEVLTWDPPRIFAFTWGGETIEITLQQDGEFTVMTFTHFLNHPSVAARNGSGWAACLHELGTMLGAEQHGIDFESLYADYLRRMGPSTGIPRPDGSMVWERATHVEPEKIERATSTPAGMEGWGAAEHAHEPLTWTIDPQDGWTLFRLEHAGIGTDAGLAASWHALLLQLDLYLAANFLMPADPGMWLDRYRELLRSPA